MRLVLAIFIIALVSASTSAGFQVPSGVYRLSQLSEAREKALNEGKALCFMYSNEAST